MDRGAPARRPVDRARRPIAWLLAATVVAGCTALPFAAMQIVVPPGVTPHTPPARIEAKTLELIRGMEEQAECQAAEPHIIRMTLTDIADLTLVEPKAPTQKRLQRGLLAWVVRAEGTFTSRRGRRGGVPRPCVATGYLMFLDRDGSMLGMGFP